MGGGQEVLSQVLCEFDGILIYFIFLQNVSIPKLSHLSKEGGCLRNFENWHGEGGSKG